MTAGRIVRVANPRHKNKKARNHNPRKHKKSDTRKRRHVSHAAPRRRRRTSYSHNPGKRSHRRKHNPRKHHRKHNPSAGGSMFSTKNLVEVGVGAGLGIIAQLGSSYALKMTTGGDKATGDQLTTRANVGQYRAWIVAGIAAAIAYYMRKKKYKVTAFSAALSAAALAAFDWLDKHYEFGRGKKGTGLDAVVSLQNSGAPVQRRVGMGSVHSLPAFRAQHGIGDVGTVSDRFKHINYGTAGRN